MPELIQNLKEHDLGFLHIIAEMWGLELHASDVNSGAAQLNSAMLDRALIEETLTQLTDHAHAALDELIQAGGRVRWAMFTRRHGVVREMGPGRRDREKPHRKPESSAELLWYCGLIGRAFMDTPDGPVEFAYIPSDLFTLLPRPADEGQPPPGRPATPLERKHHLPVGDHILDHACTLLAAMRLGYDPAELEDLQAGWQAKIEVEAGYAHSVEFLTALLTCAGLLDAYVEVQTEAAREFLEAPRAAALASLTKAWLGCHRLDELRILPGVQAEGEWSNDPLRTRQTVIDFLSTIPDDSWWSLPAFIADVKETQPDFQRPAGDYDSWYLRDLESGEFLRGFEHWDAVDGELLRYMLTGPLHWLGVLDLASPAPGAAPSAFRTSKWAAALLKGASPDGLPAEDEKIVARSDAHLTVPRLAPRAARYQIARFCEWDPPEEREYRYRITPTSLRRAAGSGLRVPHLLTLLGRYAEAVPPSLARALERWASEGSEASLESVTILRLRSPELLEALRKSKAARFLGEPLGPTVVVVKPGAGEKVFAILAEMGYLGEISSE
jgi:hypothetical protein